MAVGSNSARLSLSANSLASSIWAEQKGADDRSEHLAEAAAVSKFGSETGGWSSKPTSSISVNVLWLDLEHGESGETSEIRSDKSETEEAESSGIEAGTAGGLRSCRPCCLRMEDMIRN